MIRQAYRRLWQSPLSFLAALLAFALGIGVNTAMYSVSDTLIFRPVELRNLDRLVVFETYSRGNHEGIFDVAPADYTDFRTRLSGIAELGFAEPWDATITRDGEPEFVDAARVSANWLQLVGAELKAGRAFLPGEDAPGKNKVAVLTEGLAQRRFGGMSAVGRTIRLNREDYLVVGLLKSTSRYPTLAQVLVPHPSTVDFAHDRSGFRLMVVGLPKPGVSLARLRAETEAAQAAIVAAHPNTHAGRSMLVVALRERVTGTNDMASQYARMLLYATGFVLLLACANVANLQLARVTGRTREFALCAALGASRWRIASQVLAEASLLSLTGAAFGVVFAVWSVDWLKRFLHSDLWIYAPMWPTISVNWNALALTVVLSVAAGLITGVLPAWNSSLADAQESLREGGRAMSAGRGRQWFRASLVAFQMTVALVLLIGAGLMIRSTQALLNRYTKHEPEKVATLQMTLPEVKYPKPELRAAFIQQLEDKLATLPGRSDFGLISRIPLDDTLALRPVVFESKPEPVPAERSRASFLVASPGALDALRIPLIAGRRFSASDGPDADRVCLIDRKFAELHFAKENPLGRRLSLAVDGTREWHRIVGVVEANFQNAWDREPRPTLYFAMSQVRPRLLGIVLRTNAPMESMLPALKQAVLAVDNEQPVIKLRTQAALLEASVAGLQMVAVMMGGIGIIALLLASVGVFSVVSYVVSERTVEIGMRMAIGASSRDIFALVSHQTIWMCGLGLSLGLGIGFVLAQVFSNLVWGVSPADFWSLASVSLLLAIVGAIATYIPARRAMRLDPMEALRHD